MQKGKVISIQGPIVDVEFSADVLPPAIYDIIETKTFDGQRIVLEVVEHLSKTATDTENTVRCISLTPNFGLRRNAEAEARGSGINIPVGEGVFSRILNVLGEPIDKKGPVEVEADKRRPTRGKQQKATMNVEANKRARFEVMQTGIKMFDLLFPLIKGSRTGILGGAALGKSIIILELMHNIIKVQKGVCVFTGAGENQGRK